jgi:hypothetical protein
MSDFKLIGYLAIRWSNSVCTDAAEKNETILCIYEITGTNNVLLFMIPSAVTKLDVRESN